MFKKLLPLCFVGPALVLTAAAFLDNPAAATRGRRGAAVQLPQVCGVALPDVLIDGSLPADVEGALRQTNRSVVQRAADIFSWREFLALNWPARTGVRGEADRNRPLGAFGPRVWETWKDTREVYLPDGTRPLDWNAGPLGPAGFTPGSASSGRGRILHLLNADQQAVQADGTLPATLTDRHGHLVRYEVRMNRVMFDFIRTNGLYNGLKQAGTDSVTFPNGAILIKASWRELEPGEVSRYLTANAWIYDLKAGQPVHWRRRRMGLVGFHIVQKTPSAPQWIWSTFEQVDNVAGPHPSFEAGSLPGSRPNVQTHPGIPNPVKRDLPIPAGQADCKQPGVAMDNVRDLNRSLQETLARRKSVLRYYELINTQWPVPPTPTDPSAPNTVFHTLPPVVANTTMETFAQDTSSCMGCHAMARTERRDQFVSADFTFTLSNARPTIPDNSVLDPPRKPLTDWDHQNWPAIVRGKDLTEHTYERLPQFVHAKLHCGSCHLDTARNPASAWWVGMSVKYPTLEKLQARVNQCFERSMNGRPIPTAKTGSELGSTAPEMHAFLTYMQWLDEQYQAKHSLPAQNGLTLVPKLAGESARGQEIFVQKCAACHGKEGQGRYESNSYYRPALWGPHSFNALAGLGKPEKLAAFVKANMPFGSGGMLTAQESWDLAAFLGNQKRPGK